MSDKAPVLSISELHGWYGESHVLHGMTFQVGQGEIATLLGRNGAGKTTTLRSILGLVDRTEGSIVFEGRELRGLPTNKIARAGIGYCPEERGIFGSLTTEENMRLPPVVRPNGMPIADIYRLFPNLLARRSSGGMKLSGGEQQMLAIGRILRTGARFLMLDEPTEGLAPVIVQQIGRTIAALKERGFTLLLVEQNLRFASSVADRHFVVEHGRVVDMVERGQMAQSRAKLNGYLGV